MTFRRLMCLSGILALLATLAQMTIASTNYSAHTPQPGDVIVNMETSMGNVKMLLYGDTPKHLNNFVKLVNEGYYDGVLFHRVINDFMVQTGDYTSKNAPKGTLLGEGDPNYQIDAEFVYPKHFHHRGAIAAARQGDNVNPEKKSSGSQFYIVTGRTFTPEQLDQMNQRRLQQQTQAVFDRLAMQHRDTIMAMRRSLDRAGLQQLQDTLVAQAQDYVRQYPDTLTQAQRDAYTTVGGTPHLDGSYTVFGEVLDGMDVIDAIQKVETDSNDRPVDDVRVIKMTVE